LKGGVRISSGSVSRSGVTREAIVVSMRESTIGAKAVRAEYDSQPV
jgi:hypothetical protein